MKSGSSQRLALAGASAIALAAGMSIAPAYADSYMAGDMHNHTTCNDGNFSVQTMVTAAISTFGLEWLGDSGHGGSFTRDCRFDDVEGDASKTGTGALFESTVGVGAFKGDPITSTSNSPDGLAHRAMWEWQIIQDYHYPEDARMAKLLGSTMLFIGTEQNVPGHEHADTSVIFGQKLWSRNKNVGNPFAAAEYEYRFDRSDTDFSGGAPDHNWTGKVANATGPTLGTLNHINKAVPGVQWEQKNYPLTSYFIPTHVERAGVFDPSNNRGFNIEHFRDFNNAGPTTAFGFETMPGHQAANSRGEYAKDFGGPGIDSAGVTTYGGTGIYGAKIGGLWDAMLGEGRNFFFYASSDFHQRGGFGATDRRTTADFFPGEYEKTYVPKPKSGPLRPQTAVDGLRSGNAFAVQGDLITAEFTMEAKVVGHDDTSKMGETLVVPRGRDVQVTLTVTLPSKPNNSPYTFDNPSLLQLGIHQPLNRPKLDHVDFIGGNVTGVVSPNDPNYKVPANPSTHMLASFGNSTSLHWTIKGQKRVMTYIIRNVQSDQYIRVRGTNMPVATPNETDASGNPLSDLPRAASKIPCLDAACPAHLPVTNGQKMSTNDVAAWADLWFYGNPIFIRLQGHREFLVETNAKLAKNLSRNGHNDDDDHDGHGHDDHGHDAHDHDGHDRDRHARDDGRDRNGGRG